MTSRMGVKNYGRSQKVVCQSNIQFDQLFNEAATKNKPSAAKSTGKLHRWGMTSFTSLRNVEHGASGDGGGVVDDDDHSQTKTIKRIKIAVDDDPFNFESEPNSAKAKYKVTQCSSSSNTSSRGGKTSVPSNTAKVNKFFKSRTPVAPLSKEKAIDTAKVSRSMPTDKSRKTVSTKIVSASFVAGTPIPCDPLAAIVAAADVSDVLFSPSVSIPVNLPTVAVAAAAPPTMLVEHDARRPTVIHDLGAPLTTYATAPLTSYVTAPLTSYVTTPLTSYVATPLTSYAPAPLTSYAPANPTSYAPAPLTSCAPALAPAPVPLSSYGPGHLTSYSAAPLTSYAPVVSHDPVAQPQQPPPPPNYESYAMERGDNHKAFNCEPATSDKFYCPLENLQPQMYVGGGVGGIVDNAAAMNMGMQSCYGSSQELQESSASYSAPLMTYHQHNSQESQLTSSSSDVSVPTMALHQVQVRPQQQQPLPSPSPSPPLQDSQQADQTILHIAKHEDPDDQALPPVAATADAMPRLVPPLTIRLSQSILNSIDFTDSGEDSLGSSIGQSSTAALTSALKEIDEDSDKVKPDENHSPAIDAASDSTASTDVATAPDTATVTVSATAAVTAGPSRCFRPKPSLTRSASASFSIMRSRRIFNSPQKKDKKALYKHRPWHADEEQLPETADESASPVKEKSLMDEFDEFEEDEGAVPFTSAADDKGAEGEEPELEEEDDEEEETQRPVLTRVVTWPTRVGDEAITSIRCPKKLKKLYTVVRNVKQAHQCHESGETQEFNDDIDYLLDGLQDENAVGTRCLSILSLAGKCMAASFRMHLRAHGTLTKVFSALQDAPKEPNLSLCTSTMMFVLSQDRLNMDLERDSLELMLQLLDTETRSVDVAASAASTSTTNGHNNRDYDKNRHKVRELCEQLQKKGHAKHLDLDNITSGVLAMETLLSLTSRRAGEWFKEELRELGGLDHLVNTVSECGKSLPDGLFHLTEYALDKLRKLDRCLKVLENVTIMNIQNQSYLLTCQSSSLVYYCTRALKLCERSLLCYPTPDNSERDSPSWILFSCVLSILKVMLNLTNDNAVASTKVGEQEGLMMSTLACVLYVPAHLSTDQRFELLVLSLGLLINLVEHSELNRQKLFCTEVSPTKTSPTKSTPSKSSAHKQGRRGGSSDISAPKALVNLFMEHEAAARLEEAKTDSLLDGKGDGESAVGTDTNKEEGAVSAAQDDIEETLTKALQKAGKNMEDSMVAAYIALLLGCLIQDNRDNATKVRDHLPSRDFDIMVKILKKFLNFMHLTNVVGCTGTRSIQRVIDILEAT